MNPVAILWNVGVWKKREGCWIRNHCCSASCLTPRLKLLDAQGWGMLGALRDKNKCRITAAG